MYSLKQLQTGTYSIPRQKQKLILTIAENKGREELLAKQYPEILTRLVDMVMIESVRASTAIEGVAVPDNAILRRMFSDSKWRPKNRDEQDVLAYKNALSFIYRESKRIKLSSRFIIELSNILWAHCPENAGLKTQNNKIISRYPDGTQVLRFEPPPASQTPHLLEQACKLYHTLIADSSLIDHQVIAAFILDFLCIHPLTDGNGRLGRLLHTLLLLQNGYRVVRFISFEGLIEKDKDGYYESLYSSSKNWHRETNTLNPWMNFNLGKLNLAYSQFAKYLDQAQTTYAAMTAKPEQGRVEKLLEGIAIGQEFKRSFVEEQSKVSGRTTRRVLNQWFTKGRLQKIGEGRGTRYLKLR